MEKTYNLDRFIAAQREDYRVALAEIQQGRKRSHWMWYIFPQIQGLGSTEVSKYYAIAGLEEAAAYLDHPILGSRLIEISSELLKLETGSANSIFGSPDDLKLRSSMTLFSLVSDADPVFQKVLDKYFSGLKDRKTADLLAG